MVAQGFSQIEGIDYTETFAPVVNFTTLHVILALVAHHNLELHQMDVKSAYLNGTLEEIIYMHQPEGFIEQGKETWVCKLNKGLYGLKQAGRTWNSELNTTIKTMGFKRLNSDGCVYIQGALETQDLIILAVYVDNILIAASNNLVMTNFKKKFCGVYTSADLGNADFHLGWVIESNEY